MTTKTTSFGDTTANDRSNVGGTLSETASQVKDKVSDIGRKAADTVDDNRASAASGLEKAASALHENAERLPGGERVGDLARATADRLSSTADYVRSHDMNRMMSDVESLVRKNPGPALAAAAFVGFLVGRAMSNND